MTLAKLSISGNRFRLQTEYQFRVIPKQIPGSNWSKAKQLWQIPLGLENYQALVNAYNDIGINVDTTAQVERYIQTALYKIETLDSIIKNGYENAPLYREGLYSYQNQGIQYLITAKRCVLADEMGLGKTVQSLLAAKAVAIEVGNPCKVLTVVKNNLKPNWVAEIAMWLPKAKVWVLDGSTKVKQKQLDEVGADESGFIIVNYEGLRDLPELQKRKDIDVLIVDEAHYLGNRKSQRTKAVKKVKSDYAFFLTGTPITNKAEDFWSLLNILEPTLYGSYWRFMEKYCDLRHNGFGLEVVKTHSDKLAYDLRHMTIRRLKKGSTGVLKDLPDKTHQTIYVELTTQQKEMYRQALEDLFVKVSNDEVIDISSVLTQLLRFRQITVSARTLDENIIEKKNNKFEFVKYVLESTAPEDGLVVFSAFRKPLRYLAQYLIDAKVLKANDIALYDGEPELIEEFQAGKRRLFLGTIKKAEGYNLYRASRCIRLDREWTPRENGQAEDRLHRIGQKENVTIYDIVVRGSVDEIVEETVSGKSKLFKSIFDNKKVLERVIASGKNIV